MDGSVGPRCCSSMRDDDHRAFYTASRVSGRARNREELWPASEKGA